MEKNVIKVGMADLKVNRSPVILTTLGLGSCLGIVLYDIQKKNAGMAHIMLPDSNQIKNNHNLAKFANTAIEEMISKLHQLGSPKANLIAKIAGGASMFSYQQNKNEMMNIGKRNIEFTKNYLIEKQIPIRAMDVGENFGRTVEFHSQTGVFKIKTINKGIYHI